MQHLFQEGASDGHGQDISLYLKRHPQAGGDFFLLVQTQRTGYVQLVHSAWRIYLSDIDLSRINEPLDVLRAFTDEFGISFRIGDSPKPSKFFLYENFPASSHSLEQLITFEFQEKQKPLLSWLHRWKTDSTVDVAIAYVIDMVRYLAALRKHGVQIG